MSTNWIIFLFLCDDIHRHSKIYYGICLQSANVNCSFFRNRSVSFWCTEFALGCFPLSFFVGSVFVALVFQYGDSIHIFICVSPCIDLSHTENTPFPFTALLLATNFTRLGSAQLTQQLHIDSPIFADQLNFFQIFSTISDLTSEKYFFYYCFKFEKFRW